MKLFWFQFHELTKLKRFVNVEKKYRCAVKYKKLANRDRQSDEIKVERIMKEVVVVDDSGANDVYFLPAAISFMRFKALPALNQVIWRSLKLWFSWIFSALPSACLISAVNCLPGAKLFNPKIEILSVGWIYESNGISLNFLLSANHARARVFFHSPYRNQRH